MMIIPYILSTILGLLVTYPLLQNSVSLPLIIILSMGIGLGLSAITTFFSFLLFNQYVPLLILFLNLLQIGVLAGFHRSLLLKSLHQFKFQNIFKNLKLKFYSAFFLWTLLGGFTIFVANVHPFGEWDAWALWNMKLKFLTLNGIGWRDIFDKLHWHTQPDYPLLLPMINAWGLIGSPTYPQTNTPFITSILFTFLTIALLYTSLSQFIKKNAAYWISTLCFANCYFIYKATSQYADTLFGYYLLCCLVLLTLTLQTKKPQTAFLTGITLGLLTFTKNEGIAISLILIALFAGFVFLTDTHLTLESKKKLALSFLKGLLITSSAAITLKLFLAPPNRDILTNLNSNQLTYLNLNGVLILKQFIVQEIIDKRWGWIWPLVLIMTIINFLKLFKPLTRPLTLFFIFYFLILTGIYLTTTTMDLSWRLKSSISRIYFYLLPSILFLCSICQFSDNLKEGKNPNAKLP